MALAGKIDILIGANTSGLSQGFERGRKATEQFAAGFHATAKQQSYFSNASRATQRRIQAFSGEIKAANQSLALHRQRLAEAQRRQAQMAAAIGGTVKSLLGFGSAIAGIYTAMRAFRAGADATREFNRAMAESVAIAGQLDAATERQMRRVARRAAYGRDFTAAETAKGFYYLFSAGMNAQQAMAALDQTTAFAQAGMFDLSRAVDLATDAQKALGLASKDPAKNLENLTRVTDVLVGANTLANATVEQFSEALTNKAAAAFRLLNKDAEEAVAVLAALADQGIKGEEAGTQLSRVLVGLKSNALNNAQAFKDLEVAVYDDTGQFRDFADVIRDVEQALAKKSDRAKQAAIEQMGFTKRTADAAAVLLGSGDAIEEFAGKLRDMQGITREVAEKNIPEFERAWNKLKDSLREFADFSLSPIFTGMAQDIESVLGPIESLREMIDGMRDSNTEAGNAVDEASQKFAKMREFYTPGLRGGFLGGLFPGTDWLKRFENLRGQTTLIDIAPRLRQPEAEEVPFEPLDIEQTDIWKAIKERQKEAEKVQDLLSRWEERTQTFGMGEGERDVWRLREQNFDKAADKLEELLKKYEELGKTEALRQFAENLKRDVQSPLERTEEQVQRIKEAIEAGFLGREAAEKALAQIGPDRAAQQLQFRRQQEQLAWGASVQGTQEAWRRERAGADRDNPLIPIAQQQAQTARQQAQTQQAIQDLLEEAFDWVKQNAPQEAPMQT